MLPNLTILKQIRQRILTIPNQRKESKRKEHYCCYLLCQKAGLRVSEAVNFNPKSKNRKRSLPYQNQRQEKALCLCSQKSH
jgi:hypothetical protein